ncbi:hypothetical protein JG688_00008125 [Phytophthora aleatoria]|uniref:Uncharacterized protein n=1 Tax=Phytophthora aleatoria TaxID=2496075 RepID=A0A8J5M7L6_9STRA|nr:hypothetical protein JG688_00008125 [Phytophthora aleatoria]
MEPSKVNLFMLFGRQTINIRDTAGSLFRRMRLTKTSRSSKHIRLATKKFGRAHRICANDIVANAMQVAGDRIVCVPPAVVYQ